MNWEKLGLVYKPAGEEGWKMTSALTPTPFVFEDKVRVYAGFRDAKGVSRIGYVDLSKEDPTKVLKISDSPVLDVGIPGTFDDNGVILGDIIKDGNTLRMYYVGFQLVNQVKFLAFTGIAVSTDNGERFVRTSHAPLLDRSENALYFNAVHTAIVENGKFRFWLGAGSAWQNINNIPYPSYNVKYIESEDGLSFNNSSKDCLNFSHSNEYRIGRPRVYTTDSGYEMIFTWGDKQGRYEMGYATSMDGVNWTRNDNILNFKPSEQGWDDHWVSYGALFTIGTDVYMVYNGNEMGKDGFGIAKKLN